MIKEDQNKFYEAAARLIKRKREFIGWNFVMLSKESGEQNKTIRCIEKGARFSAHHLVWMERVLGITISDIYMEINNAGSINTLEDLF